jgi:hypothetical protein
VNSTPIRPAVRVRDRHVQSDGAVDVRQVPLTLACSAAACGAAIGWTSPGTDRHRWLGGPKVSLRGGQIEIGADLGTRRGDSLFHSL